MTGEQPQAVDPTAALNGAQVASLLDVVKESTSGQIPRETALELIISAFPISKEQAERIVPQPEFRPRPQIENEA